jgi:hypothetical protein
MANPSCRLFVLQASEAPVALVLRRGPTDWYHVIAWDTASDEFTHGAWFKGRIYEDRCDLSPDGALFLYFALQGSRWRTSYSGAWTAVSRPPWLHALTLWSWGSTWGGGGRFIANRKIVLRGSGFKTHPEHPLDGIEMIEGNAPRQVSDGTISGAEWSGRDYQGRPIFARDGKLFRRDGEMDKELVDFNNLTPDPVPPPTWATEPLTSVHKIETNRSVRRKRSKPASK